MFLLLRLQLRCTKKFSNSQQMDFLIYQISAEISNNIFVPFLHLFLHLCFSERLIGKHLSDYYLKPDLYISCKDFKRMFENTFLKLYRYGLVSTLLS